MPSSLRDRLQGTNLYLIGMMGAGKSTIGRLLAKRLGYGFLDTDAVIEQIAGCSISQIFAESGEAEFRKLESQVLGQVSAYRRMAIATGGGIVLDRMNWSYLRHGLVIWLDVPAEQIYDRIKNSTTRPLLQDPNPQQKIQDLLNQRTPLYAQADVRITLTQEEPPDAVTTRVLAAIATVLKPEPEIPTPRQHFEQN